MRTKVIHRVWAEDGRFAGNHGVGSATEGASDVRKTSAANNPVWIGVVEVVEVAAKEGALIGTELMIQPKKAQPAAVLADKATGSKWRGDRRRALLAAKLASEGETRAGSRQGARQSDGRLAECVAVDVVAAGSIGAGEAGQMCLGRTGPPELKDVPVELIGAGCRGEIDDRARAGAVLRREAVGEDGHLTDGL